MIWSRRIKLCAAQVAMLIFMPSYAAFSSVDGDPKINSGPSQPVNIRFTNIGRDLGALLSIEQQSFEYPWTEREFRWAHRDKNVVIVVAEAQINNKPRIVGYAVYDLQWKKMELINLAVRPEFRDRDIASQLIDMMKRKLSPERRQAIEVFFQESNLGAIEFFKKQGFRTDEKLYDIYEQANESAIKMINRLGMDRYEEQRLRGVNHFDRLGVALNAPVSDLKKAFEFISKKFVPDAPAKALLEQSVEVLSDASRRRAYMLESREELLDSDALKKTGIDFDAAAVSLYERLGTHENAIREHIERNYDVAQMLFGADPDTLGPLTRAYEVLSRPRLREQYDTIRVSTEGVDQLRAIDRFIHLAVEGGELSRLATDAVPPPIFNGRANLAPKVEKSPRYDKADPNAGNFYQRLGVAENTHRDALIDAYIAAMVRFKNDPKARKLVTQAYLVLKVPELRARYDELNQDPLNLDRNKQIRALVNNSPKLKPRSSPTIEGHETQKTDRLNVDLVVAASGNYYQRLGVGENASIDRIVAAYVELEKTLRDKPKKLAHVLMAYRVLRDPDLRLEYDVIQGLTNKNHRQAALKEFVSKVEEKLEVDAALVPSFTMMEISSGQPPLGLANPQSHNLYERLGVARNSGAEAVESAALKLLSTASEIDRVKYQRAWSVLATPELRVRYDALLDQGLSVPSQVGYQRLLADAAAHEALGRLRTRIDRTSSGESLRDFVDNTAQLLQYLGRNPSLAQDYVQAIKHKIDVVRATDGIDVMEPAVNVLEHLRSLYLYVPDENLEGFKEVLLLVRSALAERLVTEFAQSPPERMKLQQLYPFLPRRDLVRHIFDTAIESDNARLLARRRAQLSELPKACAKALYAFGSWFLKGR